MSETLAPTSAEELREVVAAALADRTPLSPTGSGARAGLGRPVVHRRLDLSAIAGITLYEPEELVLSARAATPLEEIVATLSDRGQELAFEPPMTNAAWGGPGAGTLGGVVMTALSGPRRLRSGAVRDHVLGMAAVSGRGEAFKAGGRVVKNVTGYDLAKGLVGSFGTLAVATDITVKVLPKAETVETVVIEGLAPDLAVAAMCTAMGSPADVTGAAHLPEPAARAAGFSGPATLVRVEGFRPSVEERAARLVRLLDPHGGATRLGRDGSLDLWRAVRDLEPLGAIAPDEALWRVSVRPTAGPRVLGAVAARRATMDWCGGLLFLVADAATAAETGALLRAAVVQAGGGHATLMAAPDETRARVPVFQPQPGPLAALSRRLAAEFDPAGILNPGRMVEAD